MKKVLFTLLALSQAVSAKASAYFELPTADVTQITTDFKTAGAVVIGIAILFFGYKMLRALASGRSPR